MGETPDLDTLCDHVLHFLELDPEGDHIVLGGDLDGVSEMPAGFTGVESWPLLYEALLRRNTPEDLVRDLFFNNLMRVVSEVCTM